MNLTLPTVSQTTGPSWASQINTAFSTIDSHNHASGNGVSIPSAGLNINADVGFGTHSAVGLGSTQYVNQLAPTAACAIYAFGGELYYNNASAVPIQITSSGSVVGPPGQWTNLAPPAIAGYNVGTGTFSFQSDALTFGTLQGASLKLQANTSSQPIMLTASAATASYVLTLPVVAPPQVGSLLASSNTGSMSWVTAGTSISITSSSISVTNGSIGANQLAASAVETTKINNKAVTQEKMEDKSPSISGLINYTVNQQTNFFQIPNGSLQVNAISGRPVFVWLQSQDNATGNLNSVNDPNGSDIRVSVVPPVGATYYINQTTLGTDSGYSPSVVSCMFVPSTTGIHYLYLQGKNNSGFMTSQLAIANVYLKAFQL
jgi:hypothetical protein